MYNGGYAYNDALKNLGFIKTQEILKLFLTCYACHSVYHIADF